MLSRRFFIEFAVFYFCLSYYFCATRATVSRGVL